MGDLAPYIVIAGPTASGKSALALALAQRIGGEIVSCDSVQLYRGFDIGSAKPGVDDQRLVPHHMIDVVDWHEEYDAARYAREARSSVNDIQSRKKIPVVVGGTGLYLRALLQDAFHDDLPNDAGLRLELQKKDTTELYQRLKESDPMRAAEVHANDRFRIVRALELNILLGGPVHEKTNQRAVDIANKSDAIIFILNPHRNILHNRITERTQKMLAEGLLDEVQGLLNAGVKTTCKPMESIGYKQVAAFHNGQLSEELLLAQIAAATRQYAKRQCTWFRKTNDGVVLPPSMSLQEQLNSILEHPRLACL